MINVMSIMQERCQEVWVGVLITKTRGGLKLIEELYDLDMYDLTAGRLKVSLIIPIPAFLQRCASTFELF